MGPVLKRHVVLIGLPGAGKTTVGRAAAAALGAPFTDLDARIERATGMSISDIFQAHGEERFRAAERSAMEVALSGPVGVIAPGGGWAALAGALTAIRERALTVWLTVDAASAAARLGDARDRPLLAGNVRERLEALAAARTVAYGQAEQVVETTGRTVGAVAEEVVALARSEGGW